MITRSTFLKSLLILPLLTAAKKLPDLENEPKFAMINGKKYPLTEADIKYIQGNQSDLSILRAMCVKHNCHFEIRVGEPPGIGFPHFNIRDQFKS
jgi:hypothetical protein